MRAAAVALAAVLSMGFGGSSGAARTATLDHVIDGDTIRLDGPERAAEFSAR